MNVITHIKKEKFVNKVVKKYGLTNRGNGVIIIKLSAKETSTKGERPPGGGEEKSLQKVLDKLS